MKKLIGVAIIVVLVAVNPLFRAAVHDYSYSEADMRRAVEGTWVLTPAHGAPIHFTVTDKGMHASREGWVRSAGACGERSFVHTAGACGDFSTLELEIASSDLRVHHATFHVWGLDFDTGTLEVDATQDLALSAKIWPDGSARSVDLMVGGQAQPATLARM